MGKRVCTAHSSYGCGHHQEHVEAARKGWITRRGGLGTPAREDEAWFRELFPGATHAHTHPSHPKLVVFKQGDKWFELPTREYAGLAREGRAAATARQKAEARAERLAAQERKAGERARVVEARRAAREVNAHYAWRVSMARIAEKEGRATWHEINKDFRKDGIREGYQRKTATYAKGSNKVKWVARPSQEYLDLPDEWRKRNGTYTLDEARGHVSELIGNGSENYGIDSTLETYNDFMDWVYNQQRSSEYYRATLSKFRDERDEALAAIRQGAKGVAA